MANSIDLFVFQQSVSGTGAMHRLGVCWLAVLMASACVPEYRQPDLREPHAVAKLRLTYHTWSGPMLEQNVMVDGSRVQNVPTPVQGGKGVATRTALLRPGTVHWTIQTAFFHNDVSTHAETFTSEETYPCGDTVCTRSAPQTRNVNKVDRVDDATCEAGMKHVAIAGGIYIVQFDFFADRRCTVQCFRQVSRPGGTIANAPCERA